MRSELPPEPIACCLCRGVEEEHGLRRHFDFDEELVRLTCSPGKHLQGYPGILHGGYVAMFFDEVVGLAVGNTYNAVAVTEQLRIDYIKPIRVGEPLIVEGRAVGERKGHIAHGEGDLRSADGRLLARAEASYAVMRPAVLRRIFGLSRGSTPK